MEQKCKDDSKKFAAVLIMVLIMVVKPTVRWPLSWHDCPYTHVLHFRTVMIQIVMDMRECLQYLFKGENKVIEIIILFL